MTRAELIEYYTDEGLELIEFNGMSMEQMHEHIFCDVADEASCWEDSDEQTAFDVMYEI